MNNTMVKNLTFLLTDKSACMRGGGGGGGGGEEGPVKACRVCKGLIIDRQNCASPICYG